MIRPFACRGIPAAALWLSVIFVAATSDGSMAYACSGGVSIRGNDGFWFVGGSQRPSSFPDTVRTSMTVYNPSPVWTFSGIWLALGTTDSHFAQVGYVHTRGNTNEYIFVQYTDNSKVVSPLYQETKPPGYNPEYFEVDYLYNNRGFQFCWSEACVTYNSQNCQEQQGACTGLTWVPDQLSNYGEIHDYTFQPGGNSWGSHAVGDGGLLVNSGPVEWYHGNSGNYANLSYVSNPHADYQSIVQTNGNTWYTFDSRC